MFGEHFYHQRIKKAVAIFGSLFNNIYVVRKNTSGSVVSQIKVPLSYAPKRDFLDRLDKMNKEGDDGERQVAVKLPRMSFEITSMSYDATRQLPKMNQCTVPSTIFDGKAKKIYSPVPYNIAFQLSVYAKSQDDALQIVEQILPFFTPQYTVTVNPLDDFDVKEDTPVTMTGIAFSDDYEGLLEARRTIIYTLDFEMKINLYKGVPTSSAIITQYDIDILNLEGTDLFTTISDSANIPYNNSGIVSEGSTLTVDNFKIRNVPRTTTGFFIADSPEHGTASVTFDQTLTTVNGVIVAKGSWQYIPDSDYYGTDTFDIGITWAGNASFSVPVNVTVTNIADAVADAATVAFNTPTSFFVSSNDTWQGPVTYSIAAGGNPSHGSVSIINANTGYFQYTPNNNYVGSDSFVYRATPAKGTSEVATVSITVEPPFVYYYLDDFGRADGTLGIDWHLVEGDIAIFANQAILNDTVDSKVLVDSAVYVFYNNQYAQMASVDLSLNKHVLYVRGSQKCEWSSVESIKVYDASDSSLGIFVTEGDVVKFEAVDSDLKIYVNNVLSWSGTTTIPTAVGNPGFGFVYSGISIDETAIDNFEAGEIYIY